MVSKGLNYVSDITIRRALKFVFGTWIIAMLNYGMDKRSLIVRVHVFFLFNRSSDNIMGFITWQ